MTSEYTFFSRHEIAFDVNLLADVSDVLANMRWCKRWYLAKLLYTFYASLCLHTTATHFMGFIKSVCAVSRWEMCKVSSHLPPPSQPLEMCAHVSVMDFILLSTNYQFINSDISVDYSKMTHMLVSNEKLPWVSHNIALLNSSIFDGATTPIVYPRFGISKVSTPVRSRLLPAVHDFRHIYA